MTVARHVRHFEPHQRLVDPRHFDGFLAMHAWRPKKS